MPKVKKREVQSKQLSCMPKYQVPAVPGVEMNVFQLLKFARYNGDDSHNYHKFGMKDWQRLNRNTKKRMLAYCQKYIAEWPAEEQLLAVAELRRTSQATDICSPQQELLNDDDTSTSGE
jgi:hypothetical protein